MSKEGEQNSGHNDSEPVEPTVLPEELASFLRDKLVACLTHETDKGTVFVVKAPAADIATLHGRVPMHVRHELHEHPAAPVIRTVIRIYDRLDSPLGIETFTNVEQADQRADFARLAGQREIYLLFYDEELKHRLTKGMENVEASTIHEIVASADLVRAGIPVDRYDFNRAKADIVARTSL
jgi:hypothetical protein